MKEDLEKQLVKDFPLCFGDYGKDMKETCMCWGCECGDGWELIIREACQKAEPLIAKWIEDNKNNKDFDIDWAPKLSQVKEKYGTLRMYWTTYPDGIGEIEMEAERKSETICEQCGKKGKLRGQGWYYTACYKHTKEEHRDNLEIVEDAYEKKEKENG
jgi:hypothetical protein